MAQETALVFDDVRLDVANEQVWRGQEVLHLTPTAFALLRHLVEHAGQLVTKAELLQALWPEMAVTEGVLTTHVRQLRQALGDDPKAPRYIETVHRRGYRFLPAVATPPVQSAKWQVPSSDTQDSGPTALPLPDKPSLAVMPFTNMSGDPEQEYFSDGLTDDLITALSQLSGLVVIARHSVFTYKGKAVKVQEVSKELGVRYVLEGSVRKSDGKVRINAQLVDAATGHHLWAERYDRPVQDIFALQDEIEQKIVTTLKLQLTLWEQGILVRKRTGNVEAYDLYLRGLASFFRFTKEACVQAQQLFAQAIKLDPQYAEAYASLGGIYQMAGFFQWSPEPHRDLERALALVQQAIALDDSLPVAHEVLSIVYLHKRQYEQARVEAERVITLAPNSPRGYRTLGGILNLMCDSFLGYTVTSPSRSSGGRPR